MYDLELTESSLDVFKFDPNYLESEEKYKEIKAEILGDGSSSEESVEEEEDEEEENMDGTFTRVVGSLLLLSLISSCRGQGGHRR